jgi:flagellar motility protein MotE (MotC chaperone)
LGIALFLLLVKIAAVTYYMLGGGPPEDSAALQLKHIEEKIAAEDPAGDLKAPDHNAAASVTGYIAAAAAAISPASAAAAPVAPAGAAAAASTAAMSSNAIVAGAFMVVGAQSGAPEAAGGASGIPLPPDGGDLLVPAARLPEPGRLPAAQGAGLGDPALVNLDYEATLALRARERELSQREAGLASRAEALTSLENEMKKRQEAIEAARAEIEAMTQRNEAILSEQKALREQQRKDDETLKDARIQHLVTAYKGMKPDAAGTLVNSLDDDVAVAILSAMPGRNAGQILAFVSPEKAARLTKAISERRIDPNLLLADSPGAD